jgi:glycogen phosphorylase
MTKLPEAYKHPYNIDKKYEKSVAYFSMEFAIDQSLKTYSGGLGFLAGSHMRSAYELKQNMIGIGILWKKGYYDQTRNEDRTMSPVFRNKYYDFLVDTNIKFTVQISGAPVWVKAFFLKPETFGTVPMFFLSTDLPENDYLSKSATFNLYDADPKAKIAQSIILGIGGAKLLDELKYEPDVYHLNEAHALSAAFHLYDKFKDLDRVKEKLIFTTHTPEEAGNEKHDIDLLNSMSFFNGLTLDQVREITGISGSVFNHSLAALRLSHVANGVSKLHGEVARGMWKEYDNIAPIFHVTNAQNKKYWADRILEDARVSKDLNKLDERKQFLKQKLFAEVADQTGKIFDPEVLTIVWARRFAEYKRPDLITRDVQRFRRLMERVDQPVQIIWAGKPYPMDYSAVNTFNSLVYKSREFKNLAVLVGYELKLSSKLKNGSDVWLNNPRVTREASGTSGMTAAMNGSVNFSTYDGWVCEFSEHAHNSFIVPVTDTSLPNHEQDVQDMDKLFDILENEIIPTYYKDKNRKSWNKIVLNSMNEVAPFFDADRMADEYYKNIFNYKK